jgi:hypothetical protein
MAPSARPPGDPPCPGPCGCPKVDRGC